MESKEKVAMAVAGVAALGAVGFLAYKWSRKQDTNQGKKAQHSTSKVSNGKETQEDDIPDPDYEQAVKLKDEGNTAFKNGKYKEAIKLYTEAMKLSAKEVHFLLSNRSAAYLASGDLEHAQKDAEACIGVKPDWPKGYFRLGKVWAAKKDTKQAFTNYYKGFLLDPKSEELKKALEVVSPELKYQFGDLDSRSLVDNFLVKLFFEQQTDNAITNVLGGDVVAFKAAIADFLKDVDGQPQNLLTHGVIDPCIVKNEAETLLAISQIILFEHSNAEAAAFFAKKAYDLAPQNYRVLLNYASTILRQRNDMTAGDQAFELIQKAFELNPDDVLLTHTYAFLVLKKAQGPVPMVSSEVRSILKDMQKALLNPKTNHMLVADSGLRLWFKLFEDPDIQNQLLKEEEENQRRAIQPHRAYLNGLLKGAFNKLCLEPFFIACLSAVVLTNPGLEKVLSPFRTSFLFELKNLDDFNTLKDLVFALGLQHFRNNYPIPPQDDEKDRLKEVNEALEALISNNKAIVNDQLTPEFVHSLSIVALYEPLDQSPAAKVLSGFKNLSSLHPSFAKLIKKSILDHDTEESLLNSLDRVGKIPEQPYIEHLTERLFSFWDNAGIMAGKVTKTTFGKELKVLFPKDESVKKLNDSKKLKVLVACCGSGLEAFQLANVYDNIEVYAFDPSEIHIAYAVRQNKELGNEAKFYVADLMSVSPQDFGVKGFDLVIANNILHNFPNPAQAFAKLCTFVNPGGFLKASVFSRSAIMQIAEVRKFLNGKFRKPFFDEKQDFPRLVRKPSVDQAREARWLLGDVEETSPAGEFIMSPMCQFFNEFTDVIFHPTIVGFGFDTVSALLKKNALDLVGFEFPGISQEAVLKYQTEHPDDLHLKNGKYLDQFDAKHKDELCPLSFSHHLSFFAQRPDDS